jgi:hypothetical protein
MPTRCASCAAAKGERQTEHADSVLVTIGGLYQDPSAVMLGV